MIDHAELRRLAREIVGLVDELEKEEAILAAMRDCPPMTFEDRKRRYRGGNLGGSA
mgnify:CR=1 FL=1